jgi:hypothetical protein
LQGHWNYTGINGSDEFVYDANSPTLLATGFSPDNTIPLDTWTLSVTIDLDPIWIDTAFFDEAGHSGDLSSVEPYIYTDIDTPEVKTVSTSGLIPINDWSVEFRVYGEGDDIGVHNLLDAQMAIGIPAPIALQGISPVLWIKDPAAGSTLSQIDNPGILSRGGIGHESGGYLDYIFTYIIPAIYTNGITRVGTEGYVNFNLKYTPFAKTTAADWQSAIGQPLSKFFTVPEWIIRNGVNDKPQNERTNFEDPGLPSGNPNTGLNWNGSIPFAVAYLRSTPPPGFDYIDPFPPDDTDADGYDPDWQDPNFLYHWPPKLVLTDGGWDNIDSSTGIGTISFNAKGDTYSDPFFSATKPANWYYTVKPTADPPVTPLISEINSVPSSLEETITPGVMQRQIQISGYVPGQDYDVWVIAIKDYVVSSPLLISGSEGSMIVDWDFD